MNLETTDFTPQRIGSLLRIVFARLWQETAGLPVEAALEHVALVGQLTDYEAGCYPSTNTPRFERTLRLATIPLVQAGWLEKNKGRWYLTESGRRACKGFKRVEDFHEEAVRLFAEWQHNRSILSLATEEAEEKAWKQVREYLQALKPFEFQELVSDLLQAMGYHIAWVAPPGKERGYVNFLAYTDPMGLSLPRIKVHISHSGQPALVEGFRTFVSSLGLRDSGIFVSTSGFSGSVREEARAFESARVALVDLENFFDLWVEYYERLAQEARLRLPLKPIYFLSYLK
ncbi:MAG: Mrr restriction system protein [Chloroflexi bacterium]|nr:Mrr restriction system protein [Chloroflexota bacterium]